MTTMNEHFASAHPVWGDAEYASAMWVSHGDSWSLVKTYDDPWDGVEPMIRLGRPAMLEMFGWATAFDTGERKRCRVLFFVNGDGEPTVSAQFADSDELVTDESIEGAFMEYYHAVASVLAG